MNKLNTTAVRAAVASVALVAAVTLTVTTPASATTPTLLSTGSHSTAVADLQRQLNAELGEITPLDTDGAYGPLTRDAVTWFQTCAAIDIDGIAGPQTLAALAANTGRKVDTVCIRPAN